MIEYKGDQKTEIMLIHKSVETYLNTIEIIYEAYNKSVKDSINATCDEIWDGEIEKMQFDEESFRKSIHQSYNERESINNSLFFFGVSIIENTLKKVAGVLKEKNDFGSKYKLKNSFFIGLRSGNEKIITKVADSVFDELKIKEEIHSFLPLLDYYDIRNSLIHSSGKVDEQKAERYAEKYNIIFDKYWNVLILDKPFLKKVCEDILAFFDDYFRVIKSKLN